MSLCPTQLTRHVPVPHTTHTSCSSAPHNSHVASICPTQLTRHVPVPNTTHTSRPCAPHNSHVTSLCPTQLTRHVHLPHTTHTSCPSTPHYSHVTSLCPTQLTRHVPVPHITHTLRPSALSAKKISRKLFLRRRHTDSALGLVGEGEGARRLATVEPEEVKQWSQSFENLLFDKTGLELFRGFLMTEHSDENIEFWIACQHYKSAKSSKQLPSLAIKIFNDYVAVQSKREINLDSRTRKQTYESVTTNPTRETFDEAQRRVQALMEKDSYRRFLESEIYHDLASGSVQHKS
ncbi:hypothetical protein BsWGS_08560 [Bradybaena similaris]